MTAAQSLVNLCIDVANNGIGQGLSAYYHSIQVNVTQDEANAVFKSAASTFYPGLSL